MDAARTAAGMLALNRAAFGLNYLLRPREARRSWIGRAAKLPGTQVMIRSQGIRDVALGAGALRALATEREPGAWIAAQTACDLADLIVTFNARKRLPADQARLAMAVAGASTLIGGAALTRRAGSPSRS
jgi:hypothetical protein